MKGTSAYDGFPIHGNKRELVKTKTEWISLVLTALGSKYTHNRDAWGCLSESNLLFKINSLSYTKIPDWVVDHLIREGKIWLKKDGMGKGYYECGKPEPVRRKLVFSDTKDSENAIGDTDEKDNVNLNASSATNKGNRLSVMAMLRKNQPSLGSRKRSFT